MDETGSGALYYIVTGAAGHLGTALLHARAYRLALVEVYSGPAFCWAEAVCGLLGALRKPYVLVLHGGGLPEFAQRHPGRAVSHAEGPEGYPPRSLQGHRQCFRCHIGLFFSQAPHYRENHDSLLHRRHRDPLRHVLQAH